MLLREFAKFPRDRGVGLVRLKNTDTCFSYTFKHHLSAHYIFMRNQDYFFSATRLVFNAFNPSTAYYLLLRS